jgi:hypothetical protein
MAPKFLHYIHKILLLDATRILFSHSFIDHYKPNYNIWRKLNPANLLKKNLINIPCMKTTLKIFQEVNLLYCHELIFIFSALKTTLFKLDEALSV